MGALAASSPQGNSITFTGQQTNVTIMALAPGLIRVRMTRGKLGPDYSYAVVKTDWPKMAVEFSGGDTERIIRTPELEIHAQLSPFRLAFYDREGRLISKDDPDLGMGWDGPRVRCWKWLPEDEHYFGLGEKGDHLDKRGRAYVNWNTDAYGWDATTEPLYDTIPFFIALRDGRAYGIFFDNTWRSTFDMGLESPDRYSFGADGGELNYYFFYGPDPKKVIERYTDLTGRIPLPARWTLGYHQSRYSYYPDKQVRFIADNFRERNIPCDALFLDIHYMNGYRLFTWDKSRFPDPRGLLSDLRREGFRVVTIIDPGVKVDPDYPVYQAGLAGDDFVKMPDGKIFTGKVWPGLSAWPDFTWDRVRDWWGSLHKGLIDDGVAGFWDDMNEPSVFEVPSKTMPLDAVFYDNGLHSPQAKVHNIYGMEMSLATREGLLKFKPNERPLVITRDTYAGGQRYAAVWTGDNSSTWDHLRLSLPEIMNMGISGLTQVGADIGGFVGSPSPELFTRWLEAGVFYPYCRTHTASGTRNQEPWSYGNREEDINRSVIELRYRLMPYLYNAFHEASETGMPVMRALLLEYPSDPNAVSQEGEFLFGDDLLVAPVVKDGEHEQDVYLPAGVWYDFWTGRRYTGRAGVTVEAPLSHVPIFVRGGAIIPMQQVVQYADQAPINPLTFDIYPEQSSSREYYEDDGLSFDYQKGKFLRENLRVTASSRTLEIQLSAREGAYIPTPRSLEFEVHAQRELPDSVEVNGRSLGNNLTPQVLANSSQGWSFDPNMNIVWIRVPDTGSAMTARIAR
ncbi:MAG TPA: glycoside hydrolase family 31 protein [Terriglobia bacterium]|nr:glycoside hydrolase family 31 protein [Terriglobia bacterium]